MKWIKRCFVLFLVVVSFWLTAMCTTEDREKPTKKLKTIRLMDTRNLNRTPKPSVTPQATQIPSAKGVTDQKIYRLAQLMYAENGSAKNDNCVLLTGIVVVKRIRSKKYPNTIEGVISQEGQYSTYQTGKIECRPDERCLEIAEEILRFDLQKYYPDNLVFQAEFPQGSKTYEQFGEEYFCLE